MHNLHKLNQKFAQMSRKFILVLQICNVSTVYIVLKVTQYKREKQPSLHIWTNVEWGERSANRALAERFSSEAICLAKGTVAKYSYREPSPGFLSLS